MYFFINRLTKQYEIVNRIVDVPNTHVLVEIPEEYHESPEILSFILQDNGTCTFSIDEQANESRNNFLLEGVRRTRDLQLLNSDWTQLNTTTISDTKKNEWETYRQKLRDLPSLVTPKTHGKVKVWVTNQNDSILHVGDSITFSNIPGYFTQGTPGIFKSSEDCVISETETYYSNIISFTYKEEANYYTSNTISHYAGNVVSHYSNLVVYDGVNVYSNSDTAQEGYVSVEVSNTSPVEIEGYIPVLSYSNISSDQYDANVHTDYVKVIERPASNVVEYSNITASAYEALDSNLVVTPGYTSFFHEVSNTSIRVGAYATLTPEQRTEYTVTVVEPVTSNLQSFYTPQTKTVTHEIRDVGDYKAVEVVCTLPSL